MKNLVFLILFTIGGSLLIFSCNKDRIQESDLLNENNALYRSGGSSSGLEPAILNLNSN